MAFERYRLRNNMLWRTWKIMLSKLWIENS